MGTSRTACGSRARCARCTRRSGRRRSASATRSAAAPAATRPGSTPSASDVRLPRSAGVQLHPTSLPGGRLGRDALAWVDWLAEAGQSWWQMLPLGPPDRYRSPYKAASAFACWTGLLAEPAAPVSKSEELDFREREASWIEDWA